MTAAQQYGFENAARFARYTRNVASLPALVFFINLGGYQTGLFGEEHRYLLVVAKDIAGAKALGKQQIMNIWDKPHTDNIIDVDDCIPIDYIAGRYVRLVSGSYRETKQQNDYILL